MAETHDGVRLETDYERRDIPLKVYAYAALGLLVLLAMAPWVVLVGYPTVGQDVARHLTIAPPPPRLQISSPEDLAAYLAEQRALLNSYGWVDRSKGIAREPIGEAMKRLAQDGIDGFPKQASP